MKWAGYTEYTLCKGKEHNIQNILNLLVQMEERSLAVFEAVNTQSTIYAIPFILCILSHCYQQSAYMPAKQ